MTRSRVRVVDWWVCLFNLDCNLFTIIPQYADPMPPRCFACKRSFISARSVKLHTSKSKACGKLWRRELLSETSHNQPPADFNFIPTNPLPDFDQPPADFDFNFNFIPTNPLPDFDQAPPEPRRSRSPDFHSEPPKKRSRVSIEEVEDEDAPGRYVEPYPEPVGESLGLGEVPFETRRREQSEKGQNPQFPFQNKDEFEFAEWLLTTLGHNSTEDFLKLKMVCSPAHTFCRSDDP
jgi:hypothetical protein